MASAPVVSAFSNAAPSADMHIKLIKAEVEEQWGGELAAPLSPLFASHSNKDMMTNACRFVLSMPRNANSDANACAVCMAGSLHSSLEEPQQRATHFCRMQHSCSTLIFQSQ